MEILVQPMVNEEGPRECDTAGGGGGSGCTTLTPCNPYGGWVSGSTCF